jgi:hypothetical protein
LNSANGAQASRNASAGLPCPQFPAVPDPVRHEPFVLQPGGEHRRVLMTCRRQRPLRIDLRADGLGMMNQHYSHRVTSAC